MHSSSTLADMHIDDEKMHIRICVYMYICTFSELETEVPPSVRRAFTQHVMGQRQASVQVGFRVPCPYPPLGVVGWWVYMYISLGDMQNMPTRSRFAILRVFLKVQCTKISLRRGG